MQAHTTKDEVRLLRVTTHDISLDGLLRGQLAYLRRNGIEVVGVAADTGRLGEVARREGVRCVDLPMRREISPLADLRSLLAMVRLMRRERPHIVHANTPKGSLLAMAAAWLTSVPVRVYFVTGLRFETARGNFRRVLKLMERVTCACATEVIPEGDGVARTLRRERITRKPLRKIHNGNINGVDLAHFDPAGIAPARPRRGDGVTFIFIGRLVRDKGINELVDAFTRLERARPGVRLLLVGRFEDDLDPVLPATRSAIDSHRAIEFVGYQSDVRPWLMAADALVLPSYREGFPNVILQAGAMGLPVITTDVNGADEVVRPGVNGLIIPRRDADALLDAMATLADSPQTRRSMARAARDVIVKKFNQEDVWGHTLERYRQLMTQD